MINTDIVTTVLQSVATVTTSVASGSTVIPDDDSIPQITEGDEYMTLAITPKSTTNKLKIDVIFNGTVSSGYFMAMALFQDATANALAAVRTYSDSTTDVDQLFLTHYMAAGTTSETTFRVRAGPGAGHLTFNGHGQATRLFGGVISSTIVITEYYA